MLAERNPKESRFQIIRECFGLLDKKDIRTLGIISGIQILLSLLDLIGVAFLGLLGALTVRGIRSETPGNRLGSALSFLGLENFTFIGQAFVLGVAASVFLSVRTVFSIYFTKRILVTLSRKGAVISSNLINKILQGSILDVNKRTIQETIYSTTSGVIAITLGVISTVVSMIAEFALLIFISVGLLFVEPKLALSTLAGFTGLGYLMYLRMGEKARRLGAENALFSVSSDEKIAEIINTYREAVVRNRRSYYSKLISSYRFQVADTLAELQFLPFVTKYAVELAIVIGAFGMSAFQFFTYDANHAIATLTVFLAAGSRLAPSVMRIQQGAVTLKSSAGLAKPSLEFIHEYASMELFHETSNKIDFIYSGFVPKLEINSVLFKYPGSDLYAVKDIELEVPAGSTLAIVGPSGSGKSTLVDLILGVLTPTAGNVRISQLEPLDCVSKWPGAISYVPQNVQIVNGTILENVTLGLSEQEIEIDRVLLAIEQANLGDYINGLPEGVETHVGERGSRLSGGQKQRLGIARALYTNPKLLVLDEATSAMDAGTESLVSEAISRLKGKTTLVVIAHRLSTVKEADLVIYIESGTILSSGTFDQVRSKVSNFDEQARLMGL
jgi:ABC-type multidrug transport system fused ATPase/permease subunit